MIGELAIVVNITKSNHHQKGKKRMKKKCIYGSRIILTETEKRKKERKNKIK